jgi:hypothetical protein
VISSDQRALSFIGLRPSAKLPVFNGPLECRFEHFDLYKGSKRGRYLNDGTMMDEEGNPVKEGQIPDTRAPWRSKDAPSNNMSTREFKSREFKPRESRSREEGPERGFAKFGKPANEERFSRKEKSERENKPRQDDRSERRRPEKQVIRPSTRIEERDEYLRPKIVKTDIDLEYPEVKITPAQEIAPEPAAEETRIPSKGNKFTEKRDYKLGGAKEQRPRITKPPKIEKTVPKINPESKPGQQVTKPPVNYDDLED